MATSPQRNWPSEQELPMIQWSRCCWRFTQIFRPLKSKRLPRIPTDYFFNASTRTTTSTLPLTASWVRWMGSSTPQIPVRDSRSSTIRSRTQIWKQFMLGTSKNTLASRWVFEEHHKFEFIHLCFNNKNKGRSNHQDVGTQAWQRQWTNRMYLLLFYL